MTGILPTQAIDEFQVLYKKEFGIELDKATAKVKAESFIRLFELFTNTNQYDRVHTNTKRNIR